MESLASEDSGLSEEILFRMAEIRRVMIALATIESASGLDPERKRPPEYLRAVGLTLEDEGPGPEEAREFIQGGSRPRS